jgi:hypothetical protein
MARKGASLHEVEDIGTQFDPEDNVRDLEEFPEVGGVKKAKKTPEEKRSDFMRLAESRVSRAIDALNGLSHLCNTSSYDWDDDMTDKIFGVLQDKVATVHAAFVEARAPKEGKKKAAKNLSFRL